MDVQGPRKMTYDNPVEHNGMTGIHWLVNNKTGDLLMAVDEVPMSAVDRFIEAYPWLEVQVGSKRLAQNKRAATIAAKNNNG